MKRLSFLFFVHFILLRLAFALSPTYQACQLQKPSGESPLTGCPEGTLYVSPNDTRANFSSIQQAIDSLNQTGRAVILIGEGSYFESIRVTRSAPITLLGQLDPTTASTSTGDTTRRNLVVLWNNVFAKNSRDDEESATLSVAASPDSSFGNTDFRVYNIDIENRAADYSIAPALAVSVTYANASFYGCTFSSWQDTWYTGWEGNTFVANSTIYGEVDYVFGFGKAWFQSVTLASRGCGGGITAWAGTPGTRNGVYISHSRIIRSPDANATAVTTKSCYLGRPWNPYAVAVFLRNYMDDSIEPAGFTPWGTEALPDTTYLAECDSYGPGGDTSARAAQSHVLSATQAEAQYTLQNVFGERPHWIDIGYKY